MLPLPVYPNIPRHYYWLAARRPSRRQFASLGSRSELRCAVRSADLSNHGAPTQTTALQPTDSAIKTVSTERELTTNTAVRVRISRPNWPANLQPGDKKS